MNNTAQSVVKIFTTANIYNYITPWLAPSQEKFAGSGFVIAGNRIITNAHVVMNHAFVEVRTAIDGKRFEAVVEVIAHDCDLAILKLKDPNFFKNITPLIFGEMPKVQDRVQVLGFPIGGDEVSITEGIVSRIENQEYAHSGVVLPSCQIDAAINSGNSGGPVIADGKVIGVVHQGCDEGQNIGYMIPVNILKHVLDDVTRNNGQYLGFPGTGLHFQTMENPALRERYKLKENHSGILVVKVNDTINSVIKEDDIILKISGITVANDGAIYLENKLRLDLRFLFAREFINSTVGVTVLRDGKVIEVEVTLKHRAGFDKLVPRRQYDKAPKYFIYAGFVFQPLTQNYLEHFGEDWHEDAPTNFLHYYLYGSISKTKQQVIIMSNILSDEVNIGYQDVQDLVVKTINGKIIANIEELIDLLENSNDKYYEIITDMGNKIIIDGQMARQRTKAILEKYHI